MRSLNNCLKLLSMITATMVLAGCAKVGPDFTKPPAAVSSEWLSSDDERVKRESANYRAWWEIFNDPVLNNLIGKAYRENYSLKIAAVRVLEARAQLGIAVGELYPQSQQASGALTFIRTSGSSSSSAGSQPAGTTGSGPSGQSGQSSTGAGGFQRSFWQDQINVNAAWEIDFWGKFRRNVESLDASLRATIFDYDSALVSLTADAANSYVQIRTLQKRLEIARENADTQRESLRIAEARFKGGTTSQRDVEQARTLLFNTLATIPNLQMQLSQLLHALSVLLGTPPEDLTKLLEGSQDIPCAPPSVAAGIPADLLRRRPDVRSAELRAAAQCAQIGFAKADLYPAFSLTGSFGFAATSAGRSSLSDIADWKSRTGSGGPSFQWNILNYGQITNNVRVQDARFQELLLTYQNTVLTAQQQVEDSLTGFLRSQENADYLAQSAQAAKHSLELAALQYREGSTDFTTVLTAQQALLTAQDSLATAIGNISGNLVGLYRAIGGGWEIAQGEDILPPDVKEAMARRTNWGRLLSPAAYMRDDSSRSDIRSPDW